MAMTFTIAPNADNPQTPLGQLATSPRRVRTDEGTVEERPFEEIIRADQYVNPQQSAGWGIAFARAKPSSALGGNPMYPGNHNSQ